MLLFGHIGLTLGIFFLFTFFTKRKFSYLLIIVASILPDLIDKPLGRVILPLGSGRLIGHTLAFLFVLVLIGISLRALYLAIAVGLHLVADRMWEQPAILFWPLMGGFPIHEPISVNAYVSGIAEGFYPSLSATFISELAGFAILLIFYANRLRKRILKG